MTKDDLDRLKNDKILAVSKWVEGSLVYFAQQHNFVYGKSIVQLSNGDCYQLCSLSEQMEKNKTENYPSVFGRKMLKRGGFGKTKIWLSVADSACFLTLKEGE